ncbi:cupin-2 domain-containing protein [Vairimorpha necatrix]|uniref:Cupin-2 domain-containing protein n=1 Tax=Vairimorpha necatrix TaxID=6039 RepID=A0AAX4JFW2_9MICR
MRKNFKPHAKQNKLANSYRKKTIDPGVDLNLKKDDDNLENIDDYWNMAEYVMNEDQDSTLDQIKDLKKKTLLKDFETRILDDVMEISTDGSKMSTEHKQTQNVSNKQTKENEESEDTLFDINNIKENLTNTISNNLNISGDVSNTSGFDTNLEIKKINNKQGIMKNKVMTKTKKPETKAINKSGAKTTSKPVAKPEPNKKSELSKKSELNKKAELSKKAEVNKTTLRNKKLESNKRSEINKKRDDSKLSISVSNLSSSKSPRKSVDPLSSYKGTSLISKSNKIYGMTKISSLYQGKSKLEPLVTKNSLEAGILFLNQGASILKETADNPFTLFLLKGHIEVSINNEVFRLDRDSCMFVDEGKEYNIIDKSKNGSTMFITFKAK